MAIEDNVTQTKQSAYALRKRAVCCYYVAQREQHSQVQVYHIVSGILNAAAAYEAMLFDYASHYRPSFKDTGKPAKAQRIIRTEGGLNRHFFANNSHFEVMAQCIEIRDAIADGRPVRITTPGDVEDAKQFRHSVNRTPSVQEMCTLETLYTYLIALKEIERSIERQAIAPGMVGKNTVEGGRYPVSLWPLSSNG